MLSTVYRQQSQRSSGGESLPGEAIDSDNKLLWRQNVRRLEAEAVRDAVLAVSGKIDLKAGGPAVKLDSKPDGMSTVQNDGSTSKWRRSIYIFVRRNYPLKFLEVFDTPIVPLNCTHRSHSATVLQSLTLLNDPFLLEHAGYACERVAATSGLTRTEQAVEACYVRILGRPPIPEELSRCKDLPMSLATLPWTIGSVSTICTRPSCISLVWTIPGLRTSTTAATNVSPTPK